MRRAIRNCDGFVLPLVLIVVALMAAGVGYILTNGIDELHANSKNQDYAMCILTGKNAIETVKAELEDNIYYAGANGIVEDENGGTYEISVYKMGENSRYFEVSCYYKGNQKKFYGQIELEPKEDQLPKGSITKFSWKMMGEV